MTLVASVIIMAALVGCGTSNSQKNYASGGKSIQVNMYKENVKLAKVGFFDFYSYKKIGSLSGTMSVLSNTYNTKKITFQDNRGRVYTVATDKALADFPSQVKVYFPELAVYTSFNPPRWLCRVGDFRSIEEADAMMRKMKATGVFKEVSIVKDEVNIPL